MLKLPEQEVSFWDASAEAPNFEKLEAELEVDVAIVGGGIAGLSAAYMLKQVGKKVAVIEKDTIGAGTSNRTTAKLTAQHSLIYANLTERLGEDTARLYGQANQAAIGIIESIIKKEKIDCNWQRDDNFVYTRDPDKLKQYKNEARVARSLGLPASFERKVQLPFDVRGAVRFSAQAKFHMKKYLAGLAAAVNGQGSYVFEQSQGVVFRDGDKPRVRTTSGTVLAKDIIIATNVPTFPLAARGGYALLEYPQRSYVVAGQTKEKINGMYISTDQGEYSIQPFKFGTKTIVLVGGENHIPGAKLNKDQRYQRLADYAEQRLGLTSIDYRWKARDYLAYDDVPLVGKLYPWSRHMYVVTAFHKWGLSNSAVAATILRDLITGQPNEWVKIYDSSRTKPIRSIPRVAASYLLGG